MAYGVLNDPRGKIDLNDVILEVILGKAFIRYGSFVNALNAALNGCEKKLQTQTKVLLEALKGLNPEEATSYTSNSYVAWDFWAR